MINRSEIKSNKINVIESFSPSLKKEACAQNAVRSNIAALKFSPYNTGTNYLAQNINDE